MEFAQGFSVVATVGLLFCTVSLFILSKGQRQLVKDRLIGWSPSQPISSHSKDTEKSSAEDPPENIALKSHKDVLPPSVRHNLPNVVAALSKAQRPILKDGPIDEATIRKNLIPFTSDYRNCGTAVYTPTGISTAEVKALGEFPNYTALSEIPLPTPYEEFQIAKALPRPYRPFRWAYHQNMCESLWAHYPEKSSLTALSSE